MEVAEIVEQYGQQVLDFFVEYDKLCSTAPSKCLINLCAASRCADIELELKQRYFITIEPDDEEGLYCWQDYYGKRLRGI